MLYLQIASPKSSVLNFLDSNSFEVIISIFQRTEKVPDMERLRGVLGACPLLQIRLAVWVHKSDEQAKRWEYAFMRILLHEIRVFYGGSGGKVYLMVNDTENICAKLAQCLLNAIYQRKNVFFHNKCR